MTSYALALAKVISSAKNKVKKIKIQNAINHTVSQNIVAKKNNPSFNNSLLDGFVFKSSDTLRNKVFLISNVLSAGEKKKIKYKKNTCYQISTGGKIIPPYDCMLPYEQITRIGNKVLIKKNIKKYENVRLTGSDYKKGQIIVKKNEKLNASKLLAIKSLGNEDIHVFSKPTIILFCSGDEVTDKIRINDNIINSTPEYFKSFANQYNYNFKYLGIIKDNSKSITSAFKKIKKIDNSIIVSTGGVSAGHKDFLPKFLKKNNFNIVFHRILMRPGRPTLFAKQKNNFYFGLPGNPISTLVGFHFLILPLILKLQKKNMYFKKGILTNSYNKPKKLTVFLRAKKKDNNRIAILPGQESYK
ncbi:MAG: molybdopterin molybdotransferase MoeA, partial [Burkholderiaceae bacterium]